MEITIPHNYKPREYQIPLLKAIDSGYKRLLCVWHRRAGKDKTLINIVAKKMLEKVGTYYYFFPTYKQGRKILWNGIDKDGFKFLNHIPEELRLSTNNQEMFIELKNGSVFQVIGTDNVDSIVGTNPIGCVFSEYSLQDPIAWGYIRPILAENGGWAIFNYTSRGNNHGKTLKEYAEKNPDWFVSILKATDTDVFTPEILEEERKQYILEDGDDLRFQQEYMCSFSGATQGSYYGSIMQTLEDTGKITKVDYDPSITVDTVWDLGVGDATAIWFLQVVGKEIRLIDYFEANGEGLSYYANILKGKGYAYRKHYAPHDIAVRELGSGQSRIETARQYGINFEITPNIPREDGINAVRKILPNCWFDKIKTERGVDCLINYKKEYNDSLKIYKTTPLHDWSSNGADAFRYLAVVYESLTYTEQLFDYPEQEFSYKSIGI